MPDNAATELGEDAEAVYDITRSQAFGPNRRFIQSELDTALNSLRTAYRLSRNSRAQSTIQTAANRLKILRSRFDNG